MCKSSSCSPSRSRIASYRRCGQGRSPTTARTSCSPSRLPLLQLGDAFGEAGADDYPESGQGLIAGLSGYCRELGHTSSQIISGVTTSMKQNMIGKQKKNQGNPINN